MIEIDKRTKIKRDACHGWQLLQYYDKNPKTKGGLGVRIRYYARLEHALSAIVDLKLSGSGNVKSVIKEIASTREQIIKALSDIGGRALDTKGDV